MATTIGPTSLMIHVYERMEKERVAELQGMQQRMEAQEEREAEILRQLAQIRQVPSSSTPTATYLLLQRSTGVKIEYK